MMEAHNLGAPLVTTVIPTRYRPESLLRAVASALAQTHPEIEVVVVIDGPDPVTESMLFALADPRVHVVALPAPLGGSDARNAGIAAAQGEWVAFLDDDDEWLPNKIEHQLALASQQCGDPIISCRFFARTEAGERIWPERLPEAAELLCEYLLARPGLCSSDGFVATTTIFTRRSVLRRVPFRRGLKKHQDWDWVLRATRAGARVFFCPQALAKREMRSHPSIGQSADWRFSLGWIQQNEDVVTRRAYAGFVTTHVAWQAAKQREWRAFLPLLAEAWRKGSPRPADVLRYLGFWIVPEFARRRLHHWAS